MPASRPVVGLCLLALALAGPARAQSGSTDASALKAGVMEVLSMATFGMISMTDREIAVTQEGRDYRMRVPLMGLAAPAGAAITAVARPLEGGRVGIQSMAFPASGTIEMPVGSGLINRIEFSVGKQTISGIVDPTLATESTYTADFGDVRIATAQGAQHGGQTIEHVVTDGTFSTGSDGRLTFAGQSRATKFHMFGHGPNGFESDTSARALAGHFSIEGLDRAQGTRMLAAFRGLVAAGVQVPAPRPGIPPGKTPTPSMSAEQRRELSEVVAAIDGLVNRIEVDETMEEVQFSIATANGGGAGSIGSLRLAMTGDVADDRLNSRLGISLDAIDVPALAAEAGELIPRRVDLKAVMAGVPVARLKALLREAVRDHTNPALLEAQARSLLSDPRARIGIETLAFDTGPMSVTGSARLLPRADGQLGGEIHIAARGMDALLAQVQSQPDLQQAMPLIFLAKGMARAQGDSLVWDIVLGDGVPTINGTKFGQPPGKTR